MTGKEWSDAFKKIEGREPSPQEFMDAKKADFPELVMDKSGGLTAAQWTEVFKEVNKRTPSPQEFMAAKAQGFPAIDSPEVDEELVAESQASPSEEVEVQPEMPEGFVNAAPVPEEPASQPSTESMVSEEVKSAQIVEVPEEPVAQPKPEPVDTENTQATQVVANPEESQPTVGTHQRNREVQAATTQVLGTVEPATNAIPAVTPATSTASYSTQAAINQNPQQTSTGLRILRVLAMIAIVLLTIALAVILGYFALGPLLEMLG